jgi:hypothetical protein
MGFIVKSVEIARFCDKYDIRGYYMKISELLLENTDDKHHKHKKPTSNLPSAASIDDEPLDDLEDDDIEDDDDEDKQKNAIDEFKSAATDLGEGLWAVAFYPGNNKGEKMDALDSLLKAFPEFKNNVLSSSVEQLFVGVFNEDSMEFESIRATPYEDDRKSSAQFPNLNDNQDETMGILYKLISKWSLDPNRHNTHKLRSLLG